MNVGLLSNRWLATGIVRAMVEALGHQLVHLRRWSDVERAVRQGAVQVALFDCPQPCPVRFSHCGKLAAETGVPFLIISRDHLPSSRIEALHAGAVDYIVDPFYPEELLARLRLVFGRVSPGSASSLKAGGLVDLAPDLQLDLDKTELVNKGLRIELNPKEFDLLAFLVTHENQVMSVDALIDAVWGSHASKGPGDLYVYVRSVRQKLGDDPAKPRLLRNRYGRGYIFVREPAGLRPAPGGTDPERRCGICKNPESSHHKT